MSSDKNNLIGLKILKEVLPPNSLSSPRTIHGREFNYQDFPENTENIQKLTHFVECINYGILPDGNVLAFMADSIDAYLKGRTRTLGIAFKLEAEKNEKQSPKKIKNKSAKKTYRNPATRYSREILQLERFTNILLFQCHENITQDEAAEKMLRLFGENQEDVNIDPESELRRYRDIIKNKKLHKQQVKQLSKKIPPISDT